MVGDLRPKTSPSPPGRPALSSTQGEGDGKEVKATDPVKNPRSPPVGTLYEEKCGIVAWERRDVKRSESDTRGAKEEEELAPAEPARHPTGRGLHDRCRERSATLRSHKKEALCSPGKSQAHTHSKPRLERGEPTSSALGGGRERPSSETRASTARRGRSRVLQPNFRRAPSAPAHLYGDKAQIPESPVGL
jgi:hypothetical protein